MSSSSPAPAAHEALDFGRLVAPPDWRTVDLVSDLHLQAREPQTQQAWHHYLANTPADALFILGDLFEVWVGDDAADAPDFEHAATRQALQAAARRLPIHFLHGNRDFLLGPAFAHDTGMQLLSEPTVLEFQGQRWLLSHGDLLCLEDTDYLRFRAEVRQPAWQAAFLARPLAERLALARGMREHSEARKSDPRMVWADVDAEAARQWLRQAGAGTLIHGHTHRPAEHALGAGLRRIVLCDWDVQAHPPRAQVLRLGPQPEPQRIALAG